MTPRCGRRRSLRGPAARSSTKPAKSSSRPGDWGCAAWTARRSSSAGTGYTPVAEDLGISALERIESILANPEIHELAAVVPTPPRHHGGRPRHYPAFMVIVYEGLISVYGSARQVEAALAHPTFWRWIRGLTSESVG